MNAHDPGLRPPGAVGLAFPSGIGQNYTHAITLHDGSLNPSRRAGTPYDGITGKGIGALVRDPQSVPKPNARWFMPSTYAEADARDHKAQRERGNFWFLVLDVDKNDLPLCDVQRALAAVVPGSTLLIYATRSATPDNRKWRALVPLAAPLAGVDYSGTANAFFDLLEDASSGITIPDRGLAHTGQLVFLPNRGEFYEWHIERGTPLALAPDHPIIVRRDEQRAVREAAEREVQRARAEKAARRKAQAVEGKTSPVDHFKERHVVAELLGRYGYVQAGGSDDWRSPFQQSGSYATQDRGDHWISLSGSDADAGIGDASKGGHRYGDAFDLFVHFEHHGDFNGAVKAYAEEAGIGVETVGGFAWPNSKARQSEDGDQPREERDEQPRKERTKGPGSAPESRFIDASTFYGRAVPPRQWLVDCWIPSRTVTSLGGDGGTGKSLIAAQLAVGCVLGRAWLNLRTSPGSAIYLSAEDDLDELHRRLDDIARAEGVGLDALTGLSILSLAGEDALLASLDPKRGLIPTALFAEVEAEVAAMKPVVFIADTLADFHCANENDRTLARQFVGQMRGLAIRQNCAVVLLVHPSLSGLNSGSGTSGSTAWSNSVRSRLYLERIGSEGYEADPDARTLTVKKSNYAPIGTEISVRWQAGVFVADCPATGLDGLAEGSKAERVFLKLLRLNAEQGRRVNASGGAHYAPKVFADHPESEGVVKRAFRIAMEKLLASGKLKITQEGPPSRRVSFIEEAA